MFFITLNMHFSIFNRISPDFNLYTAVFLSKFNKRFYAKPFYKIRHLCTFAQKQVLYDVRCNALSALSILNKFTKNVK